jgi:hypothetical protein
VNSLTGRSFGPSRKQQNESIRRIIMSEVIVTCTAPGHCTIPLNDGDTICLAPGEVAKPLNDWNIANDTITKLKARHFISVVEQKAGKPATAQKKKGRNEKKS